MTRLASAFLIVAIASPLGEAFPAAQDTASPSAAYAEAVAAYRAGDPSTTHALGGWPAADLRRNVRAVAGRLRVIGRREPRDDAERALVASAQAAAVLHTEAALAATSPGTIDLHLDLAESIVRELPTTPFQERWYAFAGSIRILHDGPDAARPFIDRALRATDRSPHVRVLAGIADENRAHLVEPECLGPRCDSAVIRRAGRTRLALAEEDYRQALKREPAPLAARLRLGRVLFLQGRSTPARDELEAVRDSTAADRELKYLAHLFLGAWHAYEDDLPASRREYRAALALGPGYQTPYIALSFTEAMLGETEAAREIAARGAALPGDFDDPAQMYRYVTGALRGAALEWLRAEARR